MLHFKRGWNSLAHIFHSMFQLIFWFLFFVWDPGRGYWPLDGTGKEEDISLHTEHALFWNCTNCTNTEHTLCWNCTNCLFHVFRTLRFKGARQTLLGTYWKLEQMSFDQFILIDSNHFTDHCPFQNNTLLFKKIQAFNIFNAPLKSKGFVFSSSQTPLRFVKRPNYSTLCGPVSSHLWSFTAKKQESTIFTPPLSLHETQTFWPSFNASFCRDFLRWLQYKFRPKGTTLFYPPPTPAMAADQIFFIVCPWLVGLMMCVKGSCGSALEIGMT